MFVVVIRQKLRFFFRVNYVDISNKQRINITKGKIEEIYW